MPCQSLNHGRSSRTFKRLIKTIILAWLTTLIRQCVKYADGWLCTALKCIILHIIPSNLLIALTPVPHRNPRHIVHLSIIDSLASQHSLSVRLPRKKRSIEPEILAIPEHTSCERIAFPRRLHLLCFASMQRNEEECIDAEQLLPPTETPFLMWYVLDCRTRPTT